MFKSGKHSEIARATLAMTYKELREFASSIEGDADKILEWAEEYLSPDPAIEK
jgi:hypothetical protein